MTFFFYSPLDQMAVHAATFQDIQKKAREYIGKEDWQGETVRRIEIHRSKIVWVVRAEGQ